MIKYQVKQLIKKDPMQAIDSRRIRFHCLRGSMTESGRQGSRSRNVSLHIVAASTTETVGQKWDEALSSQNPPLVPHSLQQGGTSL